MKKISLKRVLSTLTRDEMKKIMAGSGGTGVYCGVCRSNNSITCTTMNKECYCSMDGGGCW